MHLFVGSTNPVKINAVINAASETWPGVIVVGLDVPSGISEQPLSDSETRSGARNRAVAALNDGLLQLKSQQLSSAKNQVLGLGLEGGVFENEDGELWSTVWTAVFDQDGNFYESNGARFKIPDIIADPIKSGEEMGPVVNHLMGGSDVKRTNGAIGVITKNFVDRTEEYSSIAKMALGLWYGRDWQDSLR